MPVTYTPARQVPRAPVLPDLSLRTKLVAVVAVAVLVLTVGVLGTLSARRYHAAGALVVRTRDVQGEVAEVLQRLTDAETGQRGYLLTGAVEFLDPYNGAMTGANAALDSLRRLVAGDSAQTLRLAALSDSVSIRATLLANRIEKRRLGEMPSIEELRTSNTSMDGIRKIVARMDDAASEALTKQTANADRLGTIAIAVMMVGSLVSFVLLLLITGAIKRDVAQREAARVRIEEQNVELEMQATTLSDQQLELEAQLEESQVMTEELAQANEEYLQLTEIAESARADAEGALQKFRTSDRRYQFLADAIPVQVWTATPKGELDFVSLGVADYFGRTREEVLGAGWLSVLHPDDIDPVVERWTHSLATGDKYDVNFRLRRADGVYHWHLGRAVALRDDSGAISAWFGSNVDIDDAYREREERERLVTALERTNQELDQFAYVASHDLKAPLRGIANLSQWIEEDSGDSFPPESRHKMELLRGRVHRLEGLIDGILEYSRAGRTRVAATVVNVTALVNDVIELLDPPNTMHINVSPSLPSVVAEAVPLTQVFSNLIGNAIKYSGRADAEITVSASDVGAFVRYSVTDNGPGIPSQYHDRIFVVFQTLAPRDKVEGTGIGLAVVKKIVEARLGKVCVESPADATSGTGTTFHFTWPKVPAGEQ
jgi:PAS domain S-box-containing protein